MLDAEVAASAASGLSGPSLLRVWEGQAGEPGEGLGLTAAACSNCPEGGGHDPAGRGDAARAVPR